jgi:hypothetical protein
MAIDPTPTYFDNVPYSNNPVTSSGTGSPTQGGFNAAGAGAATGGALLGSLISGLGQQQGANALAAQTQQEMQQQMALQQQADQAMGSFLGNNSPGQAQQTATAQYQQPAQQYLQKLNGYKPAGLTGAAGNAFASAGAGSQAALQAANTRLAQKQGQQQAQSQLQQGQQNLGSQVGNLQLTNQRNQQLYGLQEAQAANKGSGLRALGGLTSALGSSAGMLAMA